MSDGRTEPPSLGRIRGVDLFNTRPSPVAPNVMFVCTGNICRSAYAQNALRGMLETVGNPFGLSVTSAGTHALVGHGMDEVTAQAAAKRGVSTEHSGQLLSAPVVADSGLLLALTREHRRFIIAEFPALTHRTFTLAEFAALAPALPIPATFTEGVSAAAEARSTVVLTDADDVPDPYRRPLAEHVAALTQIDALLHAAMPLLTGIPLLGTTDG